MDTLLNGITTPDSYRRVSDNIYECCPRDSGGASWSRTNNVYPEGSDLQSEDAHAIASIAPFV